MKLCLIVDDSRVVRKVARRIISDLGFQCEEAEDGEKALNFCKNKIPDAVILDWNMPIMSGIEFLEVLRTLENGDHPKVIVCTTENDQKHIQRAVKAGSDEYIMKPFDGEILEIKLRQVGLLDD